MKLSTHYTILIVAPILVLCFISHVDSIVCTPNFCENIKCEKLNCTKDQKVGKGFCGCCDLCITIIHEGGSCAMTFIKGSPPTVECAEGLTCSRTTGKCVKSSC